ncbi:enoyl-CoA hydratase/isomerase family protein [Agaribacterium haliotis]|uniref:enoyl-CoA hydratase/isomerase family protein n=1 Tax=Agaribacterium haliotis TaxID=2013869 RepID=UPI000BB55D4E|nr:enoyl-CoA hydratase-related protein [Agaribacterium haliotis]
MSDILLEKQGGVATLTFNRPKANAYNLAFYQAFYDAVVEADKDEEVGAVIIKSSSPKFFCAGADIKEFQENSTEDNQKMVVKARETLAAIEKSGKIFIAQLSGHALGGGLEILMACDLRFAAEGQYLLGLPEIKLGLIPGNGGTQRLVRLVGLSKALELLATGDTFNVVEADKWGLINRLLPADELEGYAQAYAERVASGPALAVAATKKALRQGIEVSLADGLALEKELCDPLYDTHDADEGFKAFLEKREPVFKGC